MGAFFGLVRSNYRVVVTLGIRLLGLDEHITRAKLNAEVTALASLREHKYLAIRNGKRDGIQRLPRCNGSQIDSSILGSDWRSY
jgi:hypothetical protein